MTLLPALGSSSLLPVTGLALLARVLAAHRIDRGQAVWGRGGERLGRCELGQHVLGTEREQ